MDNTIIFMVEPKNVMGLWPMIDGLLAPAIAISCTHTTEDVRKGLMTNNAQLWVQWSKDANTIDAAVVTEFINYPRGLWFRFWLAGAAHGANILWDEFYSKLYEFAKYNKCAGIEDCGRGGWNKYAPHAKKIAQLRRIFINYEGAA